MKKERIGIYGGTFSPPHLGHYRALSAFIEQENLDRVFVIPAGIPPHKQVKEDVSPDARLAMCRLAFADLPVIVSDMEIRRSGKSYTVLTLQELKTPENSLVLLCGTDMFLSLDTWYQPEKIMELAQIVYVRRETGTVGDATGELLKKQEEKLRQKFHACTRSLSCDSLMISSSELRKAIKNGQDTTGFLSAEVRRYIDEWQLYHK